MCLLLTCFNLYVSAVKSQQNWLKGLIGTHMDSSFRNIEVSL